MFHTQVSFYFELNAFAYSFFNTLVEVDLSSIMYTGKSFSLLQTIM